MNVGDDIIYKKTGDKRLGCVIRMEEIDNRWIIAVMDFSYGTRVQLIEGDDDWSVEK